MIFTKEMKRSPLKLTGKESQPSLQNRARRLVLLLNSKNIKFISIFVLALLLLACKKKEEAAASPTPSPAPVKVQLKVKIDGTDYSCNTCFSSYLSGGGLYGVNFAIGSSGDRFVFNFNALPATGNYSLIKFGDPSFNYQKNNTYYRGRGTLTITAIDTSSNGSINKLAASFSCTTDTTGQEFFQITEGQINVNTP